MIIKLNKAFRKVKYTDQKHQYYIDNKPAISVTQLLSRLSPPFDSNYWALYKALQASGYSVRPCFFKSEINPLKININGVDTQISQVKNLELSVTKEDILNTWNIIKSVGNIRGSFVHNYLETLEQGLLDIPKVVIPHNLTTEEAIDYVLSIDTLKKMCNDYVQQNQHLIPIAIEYKVGDVQSGLTGTFDRLYWNEQTNRAEIWDFKTDKEVKKTSKYRQKFNGFDDVDYHDLNKYFLQISFYKYIVEQNTNLNIDVGKIVHFNLATQTIDYYDCVDYSNIIKQNEQNWQAYL